MKRWIALLFLASACGIVALAACSNQGEGERCDVLNGHDDCKTDQDLRCYPANQLTNTTSDRCCPADRSQATAPVCLTPISIVGGDAATTPDTGPTGNGQDAGTPASDAGDEAQAPDGGADAAAE